MKRYIWTHHVFHGVGHGLLRKTSRYRRAADGKPDLSGVWQALGVSLTGETPAPRRALRAEA